MPLLNMFNNRLDNIIDTSDKEDFISNCQTRNMTSFSLLNTRKNRVASNSQI